MVFTPKTAGLALFSFALVARRAMAVETCLELMDEVAAIETSGTIPIDTSISCSTHIEVLSSQTVTITGPATITIEAGFSSENSSLFANDGTLTLENITVQTAAEEAVRAVWNTGTLTLETCSFDGLSGNADFATMLTRGGAIYSVSSGAITISDSTFSSNVVSFRGGAIFAGNAEELTITGSTFQANEADSNGGDEAGAGGDLWAAEDVELAVTNSVFSGSSTEYGGASIECCGGVFKTSNFTNTESSLDTEHFGAVLVGRPGVGCPRGLDMEDCTFDGCTADNAAGAGGSLAIFDTSAEIKSCVFQNSVGTALLFESSSADGDHKLSLKSCEFNENSEPSELYQSDIVQGSALVVTNTGVEEGSEPVSMGEFYNIFCFGNEPYECEFIEDLADVAYTGDFKCRVCNRDGDEIDATGDGEIDGASDSRSSGSSDDNSGIVIGLSLALGLTLVVIGALAVWKFKVRKNARRLMEDMGDGDL
ncbi:unnamed protein product [Hapterophycus canaliculatus]